MLIDPVVNFGTGKLWFKGGFFSPIKRTGVATLYEHCEWPSQWAFQVFNNQDTIVGP